MQITYAKQTIDLFDKITFPEGPPPKVVVSLSGGCDSASLVYLLATHFPEIEIVLFNSHDEDSPLDTQCAKNIARFLKAEFPNNKIHDLLTFDVKTSDPEWLEIARQAREAPSGKIMKNGNMEYRWRTLKGTSKALQNRKIRYSLRDKHNTIVLTGLTCNPPVEAMKTRGFYDVAERRRDPGVKDEPLLNDSGTYTPFLFVDKKFVAGIYKENDLMDRLYPLTRSCAWGPKDGNKNYPEPCGQCFWCHERDWAFAEEEPAPSPWIPQRMATILSKLGL